jgi:hypothetical protein
VFSQLSTSNTVLAGPPRKVPLPTLISVFSFQHFSFSVRSLNQSGELPAHFAGDDRRVIRRPISSFSLQPLAFSL